MPCDMGSPTYNGPSWKEQQEMQRLFKRVAELEQAMCGLCQQLSSTDDPTVTRYMHPQLQTWFDNHRKQPGCEAGKL